MLAIYGSADFVTDEADHRRIVDIVNGAHPGNAKLDVIPGMDHYLVNAGSPKASRERSATYTARRNRSRTRRVTHTCRNSDTFLPRA